MLVPIIREIILFGSQAREQSESNSDIDIYINDEAAPSFRLVLILS